MSGRRQQGRGARAAALLVWAAAAVPVPAEGPPPAEGTAAVAERCEREIVELHRFLEAWSNGELPDTDEAFARFDRALADGFVLVGPDAGILDRSSVVEAIRGARGRWRESPGRIRIEKVELRHAAGELAIATYEEWHEREGLRRGRLSTAVFRPRADAPSGLEWLHLHEVWLPAPGGG